MNVNEEMSTFMQQHFADRLYAEGFVSYRNNMRHWYKLVDESVLQMVILDYHRGDKKNFDFLYGAAPLYALFPLPYAHKIEKTSYCDILSDAHYAYMWKHKDLNSYNLPLSARFYGETLRRYTGAFEEIIWPEFHQIVNLNTCHQLWWERRQRINAVRPYYDIQRGIWELIYGHHKEELAAFITARFISDCQSWGESEHQTYLPETWRARFKVYYEYAKRIIHDSETDNWDDLDLMVQENMQQMREFVRKKLKL